MEHKVEQRSDEWHALRIGHLSPSRFPDLMKSPKQRTEWNQTQLAILREIAAERITQTHEESFTSKAMQWGIDNEEHADYLFQVQEFETVRHTGYIERDEWTGGSPDGIIVRDGEDWGIVEYKAPMSKTHLMYELDTDELYKAYGMQVMGYCLITGLMNWALCSYDPRFPDGRQLVVLRGEFTDEDLQPMRDRLDSAIEIIKGWL